MLSAFLALESRCVFDVVAKLGKFGHFRNFCVRWEKMAKIKNIKMRFGIFDFDDSDSTTRGVHYGSGLGIGNNTILKNLCVVVGAARFKWTPRLSLVTYTGGGDGTLRLG
jgi:hypothetical protein